MLFRMDAQQQQPSQLPFGWVCFSNANYSRTNEVTEAVVSIAFRLGLFL